MRLHVSITPRLEEVLGAAAPGRSRCHLLPDCLVQRYFALVARIERTSRKTGFRAFSPVSQSSVSRRIGHLTYLDLDQEPYIYSYRACGIGD